jgi:hypothetical protein
MNKQQAIKIFEDKKNSYNVEHGRRRVVFFGC